MKVILTENVKSLGNVGDLVSVSQGFGRNFLIPRKKAVMADENNRKELEDNQRRLQGKVNAALNLAKETAKKIDGITLEFTKRVAATGKLFGTVSSAELAKTLESKGIVVERRQIVPKEAIKSVGTFEVVAKLFTGVEPTFKVKVIMDPAQVEEMKKRQEAALKAKAKREAAAKEEAEKAAAAGETATTESADE